MAVLKAGNIGRVLVGATNDAKVAIGRGSTANDHTLLVAANDTKLPMLSDRNTSYHRFELLQGRKALARMQSRVHLRHVGKM